MLPPAIGDTPGVLAGKPPTPSTATPWEVTVACRRVTRRREVIARNTSVVNTEGMQCGKWRTQTSIVCIVVHGLHDDPEHDLDLDEGLALPRICFVIEAYFSQANLESDRQIFDKFLVSLPQGRHGAAQSAGARSAHQITTVKFAHSSQPATS